MSDAWGQPTHRVRCEWGPTGGLAVATGADVVVVVDVLSFTTTVGVALDLGVAVLPYRWRDDTAPAFAVAHDAALAGGRSAAGDDGLSLSPASLRRAAERGGLPARLVLPSPNGSTICAALREQQDAPRVLAGSLRNRTAVALAVAEVLRDGGSVADDLPTALHACASGRELVAGGFAADVGMAAEVDASLMVPELGADGAFTARRT